MTEKHIKYPVMGCVTDEELRDLSMKWSFEKLRRKIGGIDKDIEGLDDLLVSMLRQRKILMKTLRKKGREEYG